MAAGPRVNSNTVWYKLVAPSSGGVRVNTFGSNYDTVLAAFTGSRGSLSLMTSNDDAGNGYQSEIAFNVQSGGTYYIEIAQYDTPGGGTLHLSATLGGAFAATPEPTAVPTYAPWPTSTPWPTATVTPTVVVGPPPSNDDIASATNVSSLPYTVTEDTSGATRASDDPAMGGNSGANANTVWFRVVAPATGALRINTFGSNYDTVLAVFTGSRGSLSLVASNDDMGNDGASEVVVNVVAGVSYFVEAAQYGDPRGGQLRLTMSSDLADSSTPIGTVTPKGAAVAGFLPPVPPEVRSTRAVTRDDRYFAVTGYRIDADLFWDLFQKRGGVRTFGYPVSWEFEFLGFKVQFFQRAILQQMPDGRVATMNLLDDGLMPYTRINSSTFPSPEKRLIEAAPLPTDPQYGAKAIAFVEQNVPDEWEGKSVNFLKTFLSTVRYEDAFSNGEGDPALVPLLNLELFGLPVSGPTYDPSNRDFIYQRFQRGILMYDATTGLTQGLLLADYLKSLITGRNLPVDLEQQAKAGRFYRQYDPGLPGSLARPQLLPGTVLTGAFDRDIP